MFNEYYNRWRSKKKLAIEKIRAFGQTVHSYSIQTFGERPILVHHTKIKIDIVKMCKSTVIKTLLDQK